MKRSRERSRSNAQRSHGGYNDEWNIPRESSVAPLFSGAKLDCGDPDRTGLARGPLRYDLIDSLFEIDPNNTESLIGGPHSFQSIRGIVIPELLK